MADAEVLGQAKQNKFCDPFARENKLKRALFAFPLAYS